MAKTALCTTCEHSDICKYKEEYIEEFNVIKDKEHPIFTLTLNCSKFKDERPSIVSRM